LGEYNGFSARAVILGVLLSVVYSSVNIYLNVNFGWTFSFGTMTIVLTYLLFRGSDPSNKLREMGVAMITSSSGLTMGYTIALLIYFRQTFSELSIPEWLVPSSQSLAGKSIVLADWAMPIAYLFFVAASSSLVGYLFALKTREMFLSDERMTFPIYMAPATLAESTLKGGEAARFVGNFALGGAIVTLLQYSLKIVGVNAVEVDLTPLLPGGFVFAVSLGLGFMAIGYIVGAKTALTIFGTGLFAYLVLTPILVSRGVLTYSRDSMEVYNSLLMKVTVSPVLGMLILGGLTLSLVALLRRLVSGRRRVDERRVGYVELFSQFYSRVFRDRKFLLVFSVLVICSLVVTYLLNPFYPFPPYVSVLFYGYTLLMGNFLEFIIVARMQGEAGIGTGTAGIMLYEVPKFVTGYRGLAGYLALFTNAQWSGSALMGYQKIAEKLRLRIGTIVKAILVTWVPTFLATAILVLALWKCVGFFTSAMPCINLLQMGVLYRMLATGTVEGIVEPVTFLAGALIGTVLEAATPLSMFGVALGLILPPHYPIAFGVGGLVRYYTNRRFGKRWFLEKGLIAGSGVLAGSMIVQVFMMIILKLVLNV